MSKTTPITILLLTVFVGNVLSKDYYWRRFTGVIPEDAFRAAVIDDIDTYIGNVYVHNVGVLIGPLTATSNTIEVTGGIEFAGDIYHRHDNIKILCTQAPEKLEWVLTNRTDLLELDREWVVGGWQSDEEGNLYVGRIEFDGVKIGKIDGYYEKAVDIYFVYDKKEYSTAYLHSNFNYESLAYNSGRK